MKTVSRQKNRFDAKSDVLATHQPALLLLVVGLTHSRIPAATKGFVLPEPMKDFRVRE